MCFANWTGYRNRLSEQLAWECVAATWQTAHRTMLAKVMVGLVALFLEHTNIWQTQGPVEEVELIHECKMYH